MRLIPSMTTKVSIQIDEQIESFSAYMTNERFLIQMNQFVAF